MKQTKSKKPDGVPFTSTKFCMNVFNLLASTYGMPSNPLWIFKPDPEAKTITEEKSSSFQSRIVDLRLRRQQENIAEQANKQNEYLASTIEEVYQKLKEETEDIEDAFAAETANRSEMSFSKRTLTNDTDNSPRFQRPKKSPYQSLNMKNIENEYSTRLEQSYRKGKARAEARFCKMQEYAAEETASFRNADDGNSDMCYE